MDQKRKMKRKYIRLKTTLVFIFIFLAVWCVIWIINQSQERREKLKAYLYSGVYCKPGGISAEQISCGIGSDEADCGKGI